VLVEETCVKYSTDNVLGKRSDLTSLVENTTESASFGGICGCTSEEKDACLTSSDSTDDTDLTVSKRAPSTNCVYPALWYNCDFFPDKSIKNENQQTQGISKYQNFLGICSNIRNYLQANMGQAGVGSNWMTLEFIDQELAALRKNREQACGTGTDGKLTQLCAEEKRNLWPRNVYDAWLKRDGSYVSEPGWDETISCDEFPCECSNHSRPDHI
jgi:hypothetical protein